MSKDAAAAAFFFAASRHARLLHTHHSGAIPAKPHFAVVSRHILLK
jgi:hypothetical protein